MVRVLQIIMTMMRTSIRLRPIHTSATHDINNATHTTIVATHHNHHADVDIMRTITLIVIVVVMIMVVTRIRVTLNMSMTIITE